MNAALTKRLTLVGLAILGAWLLIWPPAGAAATTVVRLAIGLACAAPLLVLLLTGLGHSRKWGVWVAIVMIPYFALSVGAFLVAPTREPDGALFATLVAVLFFAGISASRQPGPR